jgi:hypothetical protein
VPAIAVQLDRDMRQCAELHLFHGGLVNRKGGACQEVW